MVRGLVAWWLPGPLWEAFFGRASPILAGDWLSQVSGGPRDIGHATLKSLGTLDEWRAKKMPLEINMQIESDESRSDSGDSEEQ